MSCDRCGVPMKGCDIDETDTYCGFCARKLGVSNKKPQLQTVIHNGEVFQQLSWQKTSIVCFGFATVFSFILWAISLQNAVIESMFTHLIIFTYVFWLIPGHWIISKCMVPVRVRNG